MFTLCFRQQENKRSPRAVSKPFDDKFPATYIVKLWLMNRVFDRNTDENCGLGIFLFIMESFSGHSTTAWAVVGGLKFRLLRNSTIRALDVWIGSMFYWTNDCRIVLMMLTLQPHPFDGYYLSIGLPFSSYYVSFSYSAAVALPTANRVWPCATITTIFSPLCSTDPWNSRYPWTDRMANGWMEGQRLPAAAAADSRPLVVTVTSGVRF